MQDQKQWDIQWSHTTARLVFTLVGEGGKVKQSQRDFNAQHPNYFHVQQPKTQTVRQNTKCSLLTNYPYIIVDSRDLIFSL